MKPGKHQRGKQRLQDIWWKLNDRAQYFVLRSYTMHELRWLERVSYTIVHYNSAMSCCALYCNVVQCGIVLCCTWLFCVVLCCASVLCLALFCSVVRQWCTLLLLHRPFILHNSFARLSLYSNQIDNLHYNFCHFKQADDIYTEAVGIGTGINQDTLQQIAGANNPVLLVDDFDKLQEEISDIKSKACSGEWSEIINRRFWFTWAIFLIPKLRSIFKFKAVFFHLHLLRIIISFIHFHEIDPSCIFSTKLIRVLPPLMKY